MLPSIISVEMSDVLLIVGLHFDIQLMLCLLPLCAMYSQSLLDCCRICQDQTLLSSCSREEQTETEKDAFEAEEHPKRQQIHRRQADTSCSWQRRLRGETPHRGDKEETWNRANGSTANCQGLRRELGQRRARDECRRQKFSGSQAIWRKR